ncbi:MAG: sigma-70 family RNA polymerase sigma factor [Cyclobacteriaceae bacterium]|nr:sigma-70 family RNA polymerase sigma factor [Cyclobacteriaceae bacterium]
MHFQIYSAREKELIEGCRRNERSAQKKLYEQMAGKMLSLCCRYIKDRMEAEDVLVTSFTKVFDRIDQFKGEGSFEGWVRRIVVNESLSYLRKNKNMYLETDLAAADHEPDYTSLSTHLETEDLLKLIAGLPPGYQIVFNMYAIDGFSHKEIADHLGINENTSKSQLSRARGHLQAKLMELEKSTQPKQKEK